MALWGDTKLFFCLLFITCCCTVTLAQIPMDCCLSVVNKTVHKQRIIDYRQQIRGQGCSIDAMILLTRGGKTLCVTAGEPWIQDVVRHVDALGKYCKKHNYKPKRCDKVKRV
ncbi:monocyte chemotactic protein 1B-like [Cebidichthys violaceus]|uniref:monocyte chemotactic protein 1B-like n=1 Tax=Cebidichthys violaceus TaxID=271503 RepID=UPI0035CB727B